MTDGPTPHRQAHHTMLPEEFRNYLGHSPSIPGIINGRSADDLTKKGIDRLYEIASEISGAYFQHTGKKSNIMLSDVNAICAKAFEKMTSPTSPDLLNTALFYS